MIEVASVSVACTITGLSELGSTCENTIVRRRSPIDWAARTQSLPRWPSIAPRSSRAKIGTLTIAIAIITDSSDWPRITEIVIAVSRPGIDSMRSQIRMSTLSILPPNAPATPPRISPKVSPSSVDTTPTSSDWRAPYSSRDSSSRPSWSAPSGKPGRGPGADPGRTSLSRSWSFGSCPASSGANAATNTKASTSRAPRIAAGFRRSRRNASLHRLPAASSPANEPGVPAASTCVAVVMAFSPHSHPGVQHAVRQVYDQVDHDVHDRDDEDGALQDGVVLVENRAVDLLPDAGEGEHGLGQDRTREQQAQLQADRGDHRQHRVAQHVPPPDHRRGQALGLGRAHVVLVDDVEHGGPGDPDDDRQRDRAEGDRGQDEVFDRVPGRVVLPGEEAVEDEKVGDVGGVDADVLAAGRWQPAQLDREDVLEQERQEEHRDRDADERADDRQVVEDPAVPPGGEVAERDPDAHREDQRRDGQLDRARELGPQDLGDRATRLDGVTEVESGDPLEIAPVLNPDRLVEPVRVVDRGDPLRCRPLPQEGRCRPSREEAQPQEQQDRQAEQDRDQLQQTPYDEGQHPGRLLAGGVG